MISKRLLGACIAAALSMGAMAFAAEAAEVNTGVSAEQVVQVAEAVTASDTVSATAATVDVFASHAEDKTGTTAVRGSVVDQVVDTVGVVTASNSEQPISNQTKESAYVIAKPTTLWD